MFTSREPGQFPRDPEPWIHPVYENRYPEQHSFWVGKTWWFPRPKFNTPMNPILAALRANVGAGSDLAGQVRVFLNTSKLDWSVMLGANDAQMEHARKVLARLAALREGGTDENG